jgi:hypothetical protein
MNGLAIRPILAIPATIMAASLGVVVVLRFGGWASADSTATDVPANAILPVD